MATRKLLRSRLPENTRFFTEAVVTVGAGRGFIVKYRREYPPFRGKRCFRDFRLVITAAHCLPWHPKHLWDDRPYKNLLGRLDGKKPQVWAQCWFVDPVGDVAILGEPGTGELSEQCDAYRALTDERPALRIDRRPSKSKQRVWLLGLDGKWFSVMAEEAYDALRLEALPSDGHPEKGCWDHCGLVTAADILLPEQRHQFGAQGIGLAILRRRLKGVHGRPIIEAEIVDRFDRRSGMAEDESVAPERNSVRANSRRAEPLGDLLLKTPGHGADKSFRRRR